MIIVIGRATSRRVTGTLSGRMSVKTGTATRENPKPIEP
jgi:hypothetical protein